MMFKERLLNWVLRKSLSEPIGMTEKERYIIYAKMKQVEGVDKLFRALISSEIASYFDLAENQEFERKVKKGSVARLRMLRLEMEQSEQALKRLKENNEQ